jgi:hypothetical protein
MDEEPSPIEVSALRQALEALPGSEFIVFNKRRNPDTGRFALHCYGAPPTFEHRNHAIAEALRKLRWGARYPVQEILDVLPAS